MVRIIIDGRDGNTYLATPPQWQQWSITQYFNAYQPQAYGAPLASEEAYAVPGFTGAVATGAGCNCTVLHNTPHCNGTHTESVGHITTERIGIASILAEPIFLSELVSITPVAAQDTDEDYQPALSPNDQLITYQALKRVLPEKPAGLGLAIRNLPNRPEKMVQDYSTIAPPFFSLEAIQYIRDLGYQHLLVDIPSIDRAADEGLLSAHHIFFGLAAEQHSIQNDTVLPYTITEMIYVPNHIPDGLYLTTIQIPPFYTDAAPSRVLASPVRQL
jgi:arylformamidase